MDGSARDLLGFSADDYLDAYRLVLSDAEARAAVAALRASPPVPDAGSERIAPHDGIAVGVNLLALLALTNESTQLRVEDLLRDATADARREFAWYTEQWRRQIRARGATGES